MIKSLRIAAGALLLAGISLAPAWAQETIATLDVEGTVMTSDGGEFVPASDGSTIQVGERVMVAENSSVRVTYTDGRVETLTKPGVYTITRPQVVPTGRTGSTLNSADVGMLGLATAIWTAGLASSALDDNEDLVNGRQPPEPISR